jgi:diketogulonate reductase-like aldo/keto reductase
VQSFFGLAPITWARDGLRDPVLERIAMKCDVDKSAVLSRWHLNQNVIPISTTKKPERLDAYLSALRLQLTRRIVRRMRGKRRSAGEGWGEELGTWVCEWEKESSTGLKIHGIHI